MNALVCVGLSAVVAGGILLGGAAAREQVPRVAPRDAGLDAAQLGEATLLLQQMVKEQQIAGAVAAVARHGRVAYLEGVGVQDLETRAPMTERSLFRIYSMTKAVTAVAAMILRDEGKFRLDDPVARYLPAFADVRVGEGSAARSPARPVTVQDLLLHTAGLSHRTSDLYRTRAVRSRAESLPAFIDKIVKAPLMEDPGTRFRYSEATTVVGRLIEVWSGLPLDIFLERRVFQPLRMTDTMFWVPAEAQSRLTTVYAPSEAGLRAVEIEAVPFTEPPALIEGAVGLVSTVPDFVRFSQMLLNLGELGGVRLLAADTVRRMTVNGLPDAVLAARGGKMGWGLANVNVVIDPSGVNYPAPVGEYGWDGTAGTIFWIDPGRGLITVLMTQSAPANPAGIRQQFKSRVERAVVE